MKVIYKGKKYKVKRDRFTGLTLNLSKKGIVDICEIEGLYALSKLETLILENNQISEIKGLENLTNLEKLNLNNNQISEIKGLENLTSLQTLYLNGNKITEIKNLDYLTNLEMLFVNNNNFNDITGILQLKKLSYFQCVGDGKINFSGNLLKQIDDVGRYYPLIIVKTDPLTYRGDSRAFNVSIASETLKKIVYHSLLYGGLIGKFRMVAGLIGGNYENTTIQIKDSKAVATGDSHKVEMSDWKKTYFYGQQLKTKNMNRLGWYMSYPPPNETFFNETNWESQRLRQKLNALSVVIIVFPERFFNKSYEDFVKCYRLMDITSDDFSEENWIEYDIKLTDKSFDSFIVELETEYQVIEDIIHKEDIDNTELQEILANWLIFEIDDKSKLLEEFMKFIKKRRYYEFRINDFIIIRLEEGSTNIYVKNRFFNQCKYLLLNIPVEKINSFDEIDSIDEAAEILDGSLEEMGPSEYNIEPEEEFWAHCSNLQVWTESGYNTRLLHSNLAFPLLARLTEAGDPLAKKAFKEEIVKRYTSDYPPVVEYLKEEGYLEYLTDEELSFLKEEINKE